MLARQMFYRNNFFSVIGLSLGLFCSQLSATTLDQQRQLYKDAKQSIKASEFGKLDSIKAKLADYPLLPYVEAAQLSKQLASVSQKQITAFGKQYPDVPVTTQLQQRWLNQLIRQKRWKAYLPALAKSGINGSEKYECYRRHALMETGHKDKAIAGIEAFWNIGHSRPDACDSSFEHWQKTKGGPSSALATSRFWKSVAAKQMSLAKYLRRFITDKQDKAVIDRFYKIQANPELLTKKNALKGDTLANRETYLYGLTRLSLNDPAAAAKTWLKVRDTLELAPKRKESLNRRLASRLESKAPKGALKLIEQLGNNLDETIQNRLFRTALVKEDWQEVHRLITNLPEDIQNNERWVYWRTLAASHTQGLTPAASQAFVSLSKERSYYGLLAADILNRPFSLNPTETKPAGTELNKLAETPAFKRMFELYKQNEHYLARREWNRITQNADSDTYYTAATLAHQWGWHDQAIRGAAKARVWDAIDIRFPAPYTKIFDKMAAELEIDTNWARAVARQESAYQVTVRSSAGARGLMQLMPKTAKQTAKRFDVKYKGVADLNRPVININLGSAYLAQMQKRFKGNQILATAAYNAGPHRVDQWLKARGHLPMDIWVETIPFRETNKYVRNVIAYHAIYASIAGESKHSLEQPAFELALQDAVGAKQSKTLRKQIKQQLSAY
ncbi:transglycosylase SLT domain-containing protein [Aliamphritea spongicola]|uniref:transglycosylase SLT domain-containing protein n=1 Tax=Aliamphritea spongicola TaxID=707589 RepID=UPI00196AB7DE|nr:transglycosylase SLT domain-containing protein [Aliamphritea spongicola]MBN3560556.1 transglycosylase SLT domain-containing protein [Aliamphritea spongicola]